jgi:hypothetical protein
MKMRRIRWGHFCAGAAILAITLFVAIYMPVPRNSMGGGRNSGLTLVGLVGVFGEFAGRYYFFLPLLVVGLYELREAFREPKEEVNKL